MQTVFYWNFYSVVLLISGFMILPVVFLIWQKRKIPGAVFLFLFLIATLWWNWGFALQSAAVSEAFKVFFRRLSYVAVYTAPALFFLFAAQLAGRKAYFKASRIAGVLSFSFFMILLAFVNSRHFPFWQSYKISPYGLIMPQWGPAFLLSFALVYFLLGSGAFFLIQYYRKARGDYRGQFRLIFIALLIPVAGNILSNFGGPVFRQIELTPLCFSVSAVLLAVSFFLYRFLDLIPVIRHTLLENMEDGFVALDEKDRVLDFNRALLGFFPELKSMTPGQSLKEFEKFALCLTCGSKSAEYEVKSPENRDLLVKNFSLGRKNQIQGRLLLFSDITEKKAVFNQMEQEKEEAQQASLEKDRFFSILSHDLKNPFTSLIGFTELLIECFEDYSDEEKLELVKKILFSARTIHHLFEELLEWYLIQSGRVEPSSGEVDPGKIIAGTLHLLSAGISSKALEVHSGFSEKKIYPGDERVLSIILRNLLSNAVKYSFQGGKILVYPLHQEGFWGFAVEDSGIGITEEAMKALFLGSGNPTSRPGTKGEQGTGLGLFFCLQLAKKAGYEIAGFAKETGGSVFKVWIPSNFPK